MTNRHIHFRMPPVPTPDMVQAAVDLVWEESKNYDELVRNIWRAMATKYLSAQQYAYCTCTKVQQDEHCLVGYPSLLCEICDGKGVAPSPHAQALEEEIAKHANKTVTLGGQNYKAILLEDALSVVRALSSHPVSDGAFQDRVKPWMLACFGEEISNDKLERCDRFVEEALELVQSIGYGADRAHALVDYVFNRDIGEPHQEVGGVMVTLAALCLASGLDMNKAGEDELARIWTKVEKIRAKQAAKPTGSALPIALPSSPGASE